MSYILDALKRAESERSRGAIPNIHAQPALAVDTEARDAAAGRRGILLIAVGVLVLAALAWWWTTREDVAPPAVPADAVPPIPSVVAPADAPAALPVPAVTGRPLASTTAPEPTAPAMGHPLPWTAQKAAVLQTPPSTRQIKAATAGPSAPAVAKAALEPAVTEGAPATAAASASERVYTLKELPDHIRISLPVLTVGGATYSENAASRMLIINGNLFHEGDRLTPEVTLQQIKLRAAVLSFRGYRYSISY